jgi:cyanophycinase-like exopeptidase
MSTMQPLYLLADSQPLFWSTPNGPLLAPVHTSRATGATTAAYVGASNGDDPAFYSIFEAAMDLAGIPERRMIGSAFFEDDERFLREADVILLAGGDVARGWRTMTETGMVDVLRTRFVEGAVLVGVSAGAVHLGLKAWASDEADASEIRDALCLAPYVVDAHDEARDWHRLRSVLASIDIAATGLGLPAGSAAVIHPDMTLEPLRRSVLAFTRSASGIEHTLLSPDAR